MATMLCAAALLLSLAVTLAAAETPTTTVFAAASGAAIRSSKPGENKTVDGCPTTCGNLSFAYPFGVGVECSRGDDFRLICDETSRPPKLFLPDGITEVTDSIDVGFDGNYYGPQNYIDISIWRAIHMNPGGRVYDLSLPSPGRPFSHRYAILNVTGCDLDVYFVDKVAGINKLACSTWCPSPSEELETQARRCRANFD